MNKLFTFMVALCATTALWANGVEIDGIHYLFYGNTAIVTYRGSAYDEEPHYSGVVNIPSTIDYGSQTYKVTTIGDNAFRDCSSLTSVTIGDSVTSIGRYAFAWCSSLASVKIGKSVMNIGYWAFASCTSLTSVTIPPSVLWIEESAFTSCSKLVSVNIGESVVNIGNFAFSSCSKLNSITIPNSVTSIGESAFYRCTSLVSAIIGNSVTNIGTEAFALCSTLASVSIGNSVQTIGYKAFENCYAITSILIPNSVTDIGDVSFKCCQLKSIIIPNSVTRIGSYAFSYTPIEFVIIGNSVKNMEYGAFASCISLTSILCEAVTPPASGGDCFDWVPTSIPVYVPANSINAYKAANDWKHFTNIKAITAKTVEVTEIQSEPTSTSVQIAWPLVDGAGNYTIEVKQEEQMFCSIVFNNQGQLLSSNIDSQAPARGAALAEMATTTATGWAYTINGLTPGTAYTYSVVAKNAQGTTIDTKNGSFVTTSPTAIENVNDLEGQKSKVKSQKFLRDGVLLIERNGVYYNAQGTIVK